uniref:Uncharacterized protein n=1 Tax=Parascaris univalens TaxID=6257 RepID=A0A915BJQ2_PARUN
ASFSRLHLELEPTFIMASISISALLTLCIATPAFTARICITFGCSSMSGGVPTYTYGTSNYPSAGYSSGAGYSAPSVSYTQPQYTAPSVQYSQPSVSYPDSSAQYSQTSVQYSQPSASVQYSQPAQSVQYSQPAQSVQYSQYSQPETSVQYAQPSVQYAQQSAVQYAQPSVSYSGAPSNGNGYYSAGCGPTCGSGLSNIIRCC